MSEYDYLIKLLLVGDSGVGKSNILLQYVDGDFTQNFMSTIGVDFKIKTLVTNDKVVKIQIWDTAGQERFRTITSSYYRGSHYILLVYDVSDRKSFNNVKQWKHEIDRYCPEGVLITLVGNKSDLPNRSVSYAEGMEMADNYGIPFVEVSAKTNYGIDGLFNSVTKQFLDTRKMDESINTKSIITVKEQNLKKKRCCEI